MKHTSFVAAILAVFIHATRRATYYTYGLVAGIVLVVLLETSEAIRLGKPISTPS
jgi:hypothetical protein